MTNLLIIPHNPHEYHLYFLLAFSFLVIYRLNKKPFTPRGCIFSLFLILCTIMTGVMIGSPAILCYEEVAQVFKEIPTSQWYFSEWAKVIGLSIITFLLSFLELTLALLALTKSVPPLYRKIWTQIGMILFVPVISVAVFCFAVALLYLGVMSFVAPGSQDFGIGIAILLIFMGSVVALACAGLGVILVDTTNSDLKIYDPEMAGRSYISITDSTENEN